MKIESVNGGNPEGLRDEIAKLSLKVEQLEARLSDRDEDLAVLMETINALTADERISAEFASWAGASDADDSYQVWDAAVDAWALGSRA